MITAIQTVSIPVNYRSNITSLGDAFRIETPTLFDKYRHSYSSDDYIVYIPSLNKVKDDITSNKLFVSRDGRIICVNKSPSQVRVSRYVSFDSIGLRCIDAAIGKSYIAALYKDRVSVINFDWVEIAEIPVPDSIAANIGCNVNNAQLTAIYNDKAALTYYQLRKKTVLIFDIRAGKLCNVVDNHTVSQDGRYLIDYRLISAGSETASRLTVLDLDGNTVFDDILYNNAGNVLCVGDYIIIEHRTPTECFVVNNIKDSRSIIVPARSAAVTNDGYIAVVADDACWDPLHSQQTAHIFRLDDIPAVKWGQFRTGGLCLFANVSTVDVVYLNDNEVSSNRNNIGALKL